MPISNYPRAMCNLSDDAINFEKFTIFELTSIDNLQLIKLYVDNLLFENLKGYTFYLKYFLIAAVVCKVYRYT